MHSEKVAIIDSSRHLSKPEVYGLFSNCGEIVRIIPFVLPTGCLRDFPGLSHYFVEFDDEDAARRALGVYVPPDVKVDPLYRTLELVPLFESLQRKFDSTPSGSSSSGRRKLAKVPAKKPFVQDRVAVVSCTKEYSESEVHSVFSTCGEIIKVYQWKSSQKRKRRFFVEFTSTEDVGCARRAEFPGFEVVGLAQNMQLMKSYKKCAKSGRWALSTHHQGARTGT